MKKGFLALCIAAIMSGCGGGSSTSSSTSSSVSTKTLYANEETYFEYQWQLEVTDNVFSRTYGIDVDAGINIMDAWEYTFGSGVTVAVIDSNFEPGHEDIAANVQAVYNFDDGNTNVTNDTDEASHGHSCAGLIAAPVNEKGIVGVAPLSKLVLIRQFEVDDAKTIAAFEFAKNQGAKVISCSWGTYDVSEAVTEIIQDTKNAGITVVFAFGNDGVNLDDPMSPYLADELGYPVGMEINDESELDSVIGVGASSEYNTRTTYSSYGTTVDLLAPGGENVGVLTVDETDDLGSNPIYNSYYPENINVSENYTFFYGTSASAPLTAGVAALMLSVNPDLTPDQVKEIFIATADKIGTVTYDSSGFSIYNGYGKINAGEAVKMAREY